MRPTRFIATAAAALAFAVPSHADASYVRECTSRGTWTFDQPLTTTPTSGVVSNQATTVCLRYTAGVGFTTDAYTAGFSLSYSGNCQHMTLTGGTIAGVMLAEQTIVYASVPSTSAGTPGVHVVMSHPTCAGVTTLQTLFHWAAAG